MPKPKYPSEKLDQYMLRLPDGMRERIKAIAEASRRSMNAEIVAALEKWLDEEEYTAAMVDYHSKHPPEEPPEDWVDDGNWEPPSEDFLLEERQRQFAAKIAREAADAVVLRLTRAGLLNGPVKKPPRDPDPQ